MPQRAIDRTDQIQKEHAQKEASKNPKLGIQRAKRECFKKLGRRGKSMGEWLENCDRATQRPVIPFGSRPLAENHPRIIPLD